MCKCCEQLETSVIFDERSALLYEEFDRAAESLVKDSFMAQSIVVPQFLNERDINIMGYDKSFDKHLTYAAPLTDPDLKPRTYLIPAACLPLYPMLKDSHPGNTCYTFRVPVCRYENGVHSHYRNWFFSVRETVFIGDKEYVRNSLDRYLVVAKELFQQFGLDPDIVNASDYFTSDSRDIQTLKKLQIKKAVKQEFVVNSLNDGPVSAASFNYHETHFSKLYNWDNNGTVVSACVGFGLDRIVKLICEKRANKEV